MNDWRGRMVIGGSLAPARLLGALVAVDMPRLPGGIESLADRIIRAFGVGMGSLSDLVPWREERGERRRV